MSITASFEASMGPGTVALTDREFASLSELLRDTCGIDLHEGKEGLVRTRLARRLQTLGLTSYGGYLDYVRSGGSGGELTEMVDSLTTNKTFFFREARHFDYLRTQVVPELIAERRPLRFWSAGCSSGDEPYTLAMVLRHALPEAVWREVRILATDISARILAQAREGVYAAEALHDVPEPMRKSCFTRLSSGPLERYRLGDDLRAPVRLARLNLMEAWPMKGPFEVIFCRNVMIYFDKPTRERLVGRFWQLLQPGGHLFVGHSESLSSLSHPFEYVQPAVYRR